MNTLIAIRLDDTLDKELDKKAAALGVSKSRLVRDAIADYLPKAKAVKPVAKVAKKAEPVAKKAVAKVAKKAAKPVAKKPAKAAKGKK